MKIIITAMMILFGTSLYADEGQSQLRTIETAKECAKEEKKLILLAFTGSDWCPPCKALKENIFDNEKFKAYAEANLVVVEVDFPRKQAKITEEQSICNSAGAKQFSVKRLQTVIILNANGKRIGRHEGYSENT